MEWGVKLTVEMHAPRKRSFVKRSLFSTCRVFLWKERTAKGAHREEAVMEWPR
jgi:hypothetical protein